MTASQTDSASRSRLAAALVGIVAAFAMVFAIHAGTAKAADVVGNPGSFTATWNSGTFQFGNQAFTPSGSFTMNVAANGTFTTSGISFAGQGAPDVNNGNIKMQQITLTPQVPAQWTGSINPVTGAINFSGQMQIQLYSNRSGYITDLIQNTANTTCLAAQATNVSPAGSNYNFDTGTASLDFGPFATPGANTCNARSGVFGGGTANQGGAVNTTYGMNGSANSLAASLTIKNGANQPVRPWPVRPKFTVSPNPVGIGEVVTFDASTSAIDNGVQACPTPDVADPDCGYRWDFNGDNVVDQVTNGPTVTHTYSAAANETPKLTIFDTQAKSDTFTGALWVQTQPVAQIDTHPAATTKETSNVYTFSIPTNPYSSTTLCSVDNAAFTACNSGDSFTFVQADDTTGSHNFRVRGITPGGVIGPIASHTFTIDRVKPRVTIAPASRPANPTNVRSATFTFTADKPGSTLECQLDGGAWVACGTNSTGTSPTYSNLNETPNPHQFRVRATDPLGNIGGDGHPGGGAYDWRVDLTSPVPTFVSKPAQPSNVVSPLITWSNDEPIQLAQCRIKVNNVVGPWNTCDSLTSKQYTDLADNSYEFAIRTLDIAGNWSNIVAHSWLLETVKPNLDITSGPALLNKRSLAQFFYTHEAGVNLTCQLDSRPVQNPCPSGIKYAYIEEGSHLFSVTATDAALNATTKTYTWSVKTVQPIVQIVPSSVPASSSVVNTADFELTTANGEAECRLDGSDWEACDSDAAQSYTDLADGNHTFEVRALDEYGNVSPIDAYSWLVVTAGPDVTFTSTPLENTKESSASFGFEVVSADSTVVTECSLDGLEAADCGSPASLIALEDGDHTFSVTATDTAGIQDVATYEWNVKAKIPGLGFDVVPSALSNSADASFEFSSDEDPDVAYDCQIDGGAWDTCTSPVAKTGLSQGAHSFSIRATDSVGNSAVETYDWNVDTVAPTVTFGSKPAANTVDVAEVITFTGSEAATFECSLDNAAFSACSSPKLLKSLAVGAHSFRVRATDETGNQGAVVTANWTIGAPAPPSVAVAPSTGSSSTGTTPTGSSLKSPATAPKSTKKASKKKKAKKASKKSAKKAKGKR